jgi:hypothetical protein
MICVKDRKYMHCPSSQVIYVIKTDEILLKKNRYKFSSVFICQRLPNMVQRLFADVIHDAIWLMNIHELKYRLDCSLLMG